MVRSFQFHLLIILHFNILLKEIMYKLFVAFSTILSPFSAPESVSSVTATNATAKSITFQWKKPLVSNGVIKGYSVFIKHGERCLYHIKYDCVDCQRDCRVDKTQNDVSDKYFKKGLERQNSF